MPTQTEIDVGKQHVLSRSTRESEKKKIIIKKPIVICASD